MFGSQFHHPYYDWILLHFIQASLSSNISEAKSASPMATPVQEPSVHRRS